MLCENCGKEHDGSYGSGRFCSKSCSCTAGAKKRNELCFQNKKLPKLEIRFCEKCGKPFEININDYYARKKRFCSRSCANSHVVTAEHRQKVSTSLKNTALKKRDKKPLAKTFNYVYIDENPNLPYKKHTCKICGKSFYHTQQRGACRNPECKKKYNLLKQKEYYDKHPKIHYKENKEWTEDAYKPIYKFYYTYKITNLINSKYYYGIHATNDLNDGYLGSGIHINRAIKKYGKENFKKEILAYFTCYKDLADAEYKLITEDVLKDKNCYNQTRGGIGGPAFKGHKHSDETKKKLSEIHKGTKKTKETREKISKSQKGKVPWNKGIKMPKRLP